MLGVAAAVGGLVLAAILFIATRPVIVPPLPVASQPPPTEPAPAAAAAEPPPPAPDTIEVKLASDPPGALVTAEGAAIGTTPFVWKTVESKRPTTLVFQLDGYRREVFQAVPSDGLSLAPRLKRSAPPRGHASLSAGRGLPPDDIKSER